MILELRMVLPQPGIPCSQRNDFGFVFQSANRLSLATHEPVAASRSLRALL